jgi:O-acetyl-ADP-ribose deacetylase (regulator of RNase III)
MLPDRIFLIDHGPSLVSAWRTAFEDIDVVHPIEADFFSQDADCMVSPANSYGIMDGGLDLAIRDALGFRIEKTVQAAILENHHGELPVGAAELVRTSHSRWPFLVAAPTMRVPENIANTTHAYLAFRAILLTVQRHNERTDVPIRSLLCPGLGTGIGGLAPQRCAVQMRLAYKHVTAPARIPSFQYIREMHHALKSA